MIEGPLMLLCSFGGCLGLGGVTYAPMTDVSNNPHIVIEQTSMYQSDDVAQRGKTGLAIQARADGVSGDMQYVIIETGMEPFGIVGSGTMTPDSTGMMSAAFVIERELYQPMGVLIPPLDASPRYIAFPFKRMTIASRPADHADRRSEAESVTFDPLSLVVSDYYPASHMLDVPFSPQAPTADRSPPFDEACEETSLLMVDAYYDNRSLSPDDAIKQIKAMVAWETDKGMDVDIDTADMARVAREYLGRQARVYEGADATIPTIKRLIAGGYPVIVPVAGRQLGNPYFIGDGPPYHVGVIVGYDETGFYMHDPGTKRGTAYHYSYETIDTALHDRNGAKDTIDTGARRILVVR